MSVLARLKRGASIINQSDGSPYSLFEFVPPNTSESPYFAGGGSANKLGRAELVGVKGNPRSFTYTLRIAGTSATDLKAKADSLNGWLADAGNPANVTYLQWKLDDTIDFDPSWGQVGAYRNAVIEFGYLDYDTSYRVTSRTNVFLIIAVILTIQPYFDGIDQVLARGTGGIFIDNIGTIHRKPRGWKPGPSGGNLYTNPIFGNATYDTNWVKTNLTTAENTDKAFIAFGTKSAKVTTTASGWIFRELINVGDTNTYTLSCYVKFPDSRAVTVANMRIQFNDNTVTPDNFISLGDGWYLLTYTGAGSAATTRYGLCAGTTNVVLDFYCDGFTLVEAAYPIPHINGDMFGCTWTGTAHASTSTRTASKKFIGIDKLPVGGWTIAMAVKWDVNQDVSVNMYLLDTRDGSHATSFVAYFNATDNKLYFTDGTNNAVSAALTFAIGDVDILHFVYDPTAANELIIYRNGSSIATQGTLTLPSRGANLYFGSTYLGAGSLLATVLHQQPWPRPMSAAQALADYNQLYPAVTSDSWTGSFPTFWNKDGDAVLDNCDDSSRDNWGLVFGVPGDVAADTEWYITPSNYTKMYLAQAVADRFTRPVDTFYEDAQGVADAGASGGEYQSFTSSYGYDDKLPADQDVFKQGGRIHWFMRNKVQAGPNVDNGVIAYAAGTWTGNENVLRTDYVTVAQDTTWNLYYMGSLYFQDASDYDWTVYIGWEHGSGQDYLDYWLVIPGFVAIFSTIGAGEQLYLHGRRFLDSTAGYLAGKFSGDEIHLYPNQINYIWFLQGTNSATSTITSTATFDEIHITPRWRLL